MTLAPTLALAGLMLALAALCGWRGARPPDPLGPPRLMPWRLLMLTAFAVAVMAIGHLAALMKGA